jgi:hypothetical protein
LLYEFFFAYAFLVHLEFCKFCLQVFLLEQAKFLVKDCLVPLLELTLFQPCQFPHLLLKVRNLHLIV